MSLNKNHNEHLKKYVDLLVRKGINIQKGQELVIGCPIDCAPVARLAAEEAYKAGARDVHLRWHDDQSIRTRYMMASEEVFDDYPVWVKDMMTKLSERDAAFLNFSASDPELLKGVEISRIKRTQKAGNKALAQYYKRIMGNHVQWCVASIPTAAWARKVFPKLRSDAAAMGKLWEAIFEASRVDCGDPVDNWDKHVESMQKSVKAMNKARFKSLHFQNSLGTDLTVEMPERHVWLGGSEVSRKGVPFLANIPTEEIFSAPKRNGVNGKLVSSLPFVYNGNVIDGFALVFKNGKVVDFTANTKEGKTLIEAMLNGAKNMEYLGEVALVPHNSPISDMGILFYNTLYDENASCHFALGQAYADCLEGGGTMTDKEREKAGHNISPDHRDFMIGTADLSIVGTYGGGGRTPVFENGNFTDEFA
jgi:aminopeptidase